MTPLRIVIADDQPMMRAGFKAVLESTGDIEVVGEASTGEEAVRAATEYAPDVVLMDVRMPVMDGIEATRASGPPDGPRILILTTFDLDDYVYEALRSGASGFLLKDAQPAELAAAIRSVADGDAVLAPGVTRRLLDAYARRLPDLRPGSDPSADQGLALLTEREIEILVAVAGGLSNQEIAAKLFLAEATVKTHLGRILLKLGLRDRVQAVVYAFRTGLVRPGAPE